MTPNRKPSILLADTQLYTRLGLEHHIRNSGLTDNILHAENGRQVLNVLADQRIDIVILDIKMPVMDGLETVPLIVDRYPHTRIIVCSILEEEALIVNLIQTGIDAYILKSDPNIVKAISKVLEGQFYISRSLEEIYECARLSTVKPKPIMLTEKEARLLPLIARGKKSREIAATLMLTKNTVESYRKDLLAKFRVNNCTELVDYAHRTGRL